MTHNEALALLDMMVMAAALDRVDDPPPAPVPGQCWIVGPSPTGAWAGAEHRLAGWTDSGWRLLAPVEGMRIWLVADACMATWRAGAWRIGEIRGQEIRIEGSRVIGPRQPAIGRPVAGAVIDAEARTTLENILVALEAHGLVATP